LLISKSSNISFASKIDEKPIIISSANGNLKIMQNRKSLLDGIITRIGGINLKTTGVTCDDAMIVQAEIEQLKETVKKKQVMIPKVQEKRLKELDKLSRQAKKIQLAEENDRKKHNDPMPGLLIPSFKVILPTSSDIAALSVFNIGKIKKDSSISDDDFQPMNITLHELKESLNSINEIDWDYEEFNRKDASLFPKIKHGFIDSDFNKEKTEQIKIIDKKLIELKKQGEFLPKNGLRVFYPETTGKIMALETAKLRRTFADTLICAPELEKVLGHSQIMVQPVENFSTPLFFKIDKSFLPSKQDLKEIFKLNEPYKPILNDLFPDGLNVFVTPGYTTDSLDHLSGGISIPSSPESGVWLNSYNIKERFSSVSNLEKFIAKVRDIVNFTPSVLKGNADRARALAHEFGHVISYKKILNEKNNSVNNSITSLSLDFLSGWKNYRDQAKLHLTDKLSKKHIKNMDEQNKQNYNQIVEFEMLAEDIRIAITGDTIPASSKMTGIYDCTAEGLKNLQKTVSYIQQVLLKHKTPLEIFIDDFKN
jgi:hypothetical protein